MKKPILVTTLGFPGSGKTYFAEHLAQRENFFHLNSDKTRFTLFENPQFTAEETRGVFRLMDLLTEELLNMNINVVYDANMNFRVHRKRLEKIAKKCGAAHRLVWIKTDVSVAEKRLGKRGISGNKKKKLLYRPLDIEILHKLKGEIETPLKTEKVIVIDGHISFEKQLQIFRENI